MRKPHDAKRSAVALFFLALVIRPRFRQAMRPGKHPLRVAFNSNQPRPSPVRQNPEKEARALFVQI